MDDMKQEFVSEQLSGASSSVNEASAVKGLKNKWLASLFLEFAIKSNVSQFVKTFHSKLSFMKAQTQLTNWTYR